MLPTEEEQNKKIAEILAFCKDITYNNPMKEYAKWYATEVIKHCAEEATAKTHYFSRAESPIEIIDEQSILNIINEL